MSSLMCENNQEDVWKRKQFVYNNQFKTECVGLVIKESAKNCELVQMLTFKKKQSTLIKFQQSSTTNIDFGVFLNILI